MAEAGRAVRGAQRLHGEVQKRLGVVELVRIEPFQVMLEQRGEVVQLGTQAAGGPGLVRERAEGIGRELGLLQFAQRRAEMLGETGEPRAGMEEAELDVLVREQRAQDHDTALLVQEARRRFLQAVEQEEREAVEGQDVQARVTGGRGTGEQLALELIRRLLGRDEQERRPVRRGGQFPADFREAAKRLAAAGGSEDESCLHGTVLTQRRGDAKTQRAK